ncbi:hypothetical protein PWT90_07882 [Aphanocladium album]|nr:hypothetical protein PWT90_07882 [Aphanocladium album]
MERSYRVLRPSPTSSASPAPVHVTVTKRHVASVACDECRRKRIKCGSQRPACSNCAGKSLECVYRNKLGLANEAREAIVKVFRMLGQVPASEVIPLISRAKNETSSEKIIAAITDALAGHNPATGRGSPSVDLKGPTSANDLQLSSVTTTTLKTVEVTTLSLPITHQSHGIPFRPDPRVWLLQEHAPESLPQTWSSVTDDVMLAHHLLALYFCWEYPSFAPLSKEHFIQDFSNRHRRYCSPMLVNALLALGCHLSERPNLHGDAFFAESRRLFSSATSHHSLTTVQALVIMSVREARCGRGAESQRLSKLGMMLAIEMGLHNVTTETNSDDHAVLAKTFWGAFTLNQTWSLMTGTLPLCTRYMTLPPKPEIPTEVETSSWIPYVDGDDHLLPFIQLSNVRSIYQRFCELGELVHKTMHLLCAPDKPLTAEALLQDYRQYLHWYDQLPQHLKLGYNSTPAVLVTHLYYHFAVLLLFRRFINLRLVGSETLPWQVCAQSADAIQSLIRSYSKLYTLKRTASIFPYIMFTAVTTYIAVAAARRRVELGGSVLDAPPGIADSRAREALEKNIEALSEVEPYHNFAKQALHHLHRLACRWGLNTRSEDNSPAMHSLGTPGDARSLRSPRSVGAETTGRSSKSPENEQSTNAGKREAESSMNTLLPQLFWAYNQHPALDVREMEQRGFALL